MYWVNTKESIATILLISSIEHSSTPSNQNENDVYISDDRM